MSDETTEAGKPAPTDEPLALRLNDQLGLVERLRADAYALPSCGPWIERDACTLPNNSCSQAADEIERLREELAGLEAVRREQAAGRDWWAEECQRAVAAERERWPDRYLLGDAILRAWKKHGQDSWCSIADDVLRECGPNVRAKPATTAGTKG
jgi:hypothetical protein